MVLQINSIGYRSSEVHFCRLRNKRPLFKRRPLLAKFAAYDYVMVGIEFVLRLLVQTMSKCLMS